MRYITLWSVSGGEILQHLTYVVASNSSTCQVWDYVKHFKMQCNSLRETHQHMMCCAIWNTSKPEPIRWHVTRYLKPEFDVFSRSETHHTLLYFRYWTTSTSDVCHCATHVNVWSMRLRETLRKLMYFTAWTTSASDVLRNLTSDVDAFSRIDFIRSQILQATTRIRIWNSACNAAHHRLN